MWAAAAAAPDAPGAPAGDAVTLHRKRNREPLLIAAEGQSPVILPKGAKSWVSLPPFSVFEPLRRRTWGLKGKSALCSENDCASPLKSVKK
jgi:hypothetical protein